MKKRDPIERLKQLLADGKLPYATIAARLNREGFKTPRGKKWRDFHVQGFVTQKKKEEKEDDKIEVSGVPIKHDIPFAKFILHAQDLDNDKKIALLKIIM